MRPTEDGDHQLGARLDGTCSPRLLLLMRAKPFEGFVCHLTKATGNWSLVTGAARTALCALVPEFRDLLSASNEGREEEMGQQLVAD